MMGFSVEWSRGYGVGGIDVYAVCVVWDKSASHFGLLALEIYDIGNVKETSNS